MAINIKFDLTGNPEPPTIILANRNGNKLGQLKVNTESVELIDRFNDVSEISFTVNKYINDEITPLWDKLVDFKLVWCKEWDAWFEIKVELDEATESVKTVFCTQLGQAELSQIMLYDIEINTEKDIEREDYKISILYDNSNPKSSILHRLLEKAPHYSIAHVDSTIANIQRSFSFDGTSICDAFQEIAEEIGCLFEYNSNSDKDGSINRTISVYDLQQKCNGCGHRGEFTDVCPKCGSTNIKYGYGDDTLIFVTSDELASEGIELVTDTDSVKNCFKLEAGDDLMTATVRNCNPNGTDYIWYFSDSVKEDMPKELVDKIEAYDKIYENYYNNYESKLDTDLLSKYNLLVTKYSTYKDDLQSISTSIKGYSNLTKAYYNATDLGLYLESGLMPNVKMSDTDAKKQAALLTASALSPVAVTDIDIISLATANSTVLAMAKTIVRSTFKVEVKASEIYNSGSKKYWKGTFVVTNYSDEEDTAESSQISVELNDDRETSIKQKIEKALNKEDTEDLSISGLFKKEYNTFCTDLKKYALNPLISFRDACQVCIDILIEQGVGEDNSSDLYKKIYDPYYNKLTAIETEIELRESEVNTILGVYDADGKLTTKGLQSYIEERKKEIQDALDFEKYLGKDLWLEFCAYKREDKYSNENYISDGLNNAELFDKAKEFIEVAENEIYKSAELQHSISTTLNNLLTIEKFRPLVSSFATGNWLRVQVDEQIYKLRLLEYDINYGDFDNISVEFSDVTKIKNGITDLESVLSQASSIATSYGAVQRQAKQGDVAKATINEWFEKGLNSALVQIQNNDSEEITLSKNGLLGRSYDEITDTYSPKQFKLTHNIMAYTTDNWKTVSSALGEHNYTYWNGTSFVDGLDYGLSTKFVTAGHVTGSQIVGGQIISSNYTKGKDGTYLNLVDGDFEIAGGKIIYDSKDSEVILNGVTIKWNSVTEKPTIENIDGLGDYITKIGNLESQLDKRAETWYQTTDPSTAWKDDDTKALHVGDLWHYTGETGKVNNVQRTKNSEWVWQKVNGVYQWESIEISDDVFDTIDGKAQIFTSTPTPPYNIGDLWVQGSSGDIFHCVTAKSATQSYSASDWEKSSKYTDDTKALEALEKAEQAVKDTAEKFALATEAASQAEANANSYTDGETGKLSTNLTTAYETYTDSKVSELDTAVGNYLGLGGSTLLGENYVVSPYIGGGYLNITGTDNNIRVLIDPNNLTGNGYVFQVHNGNNNAVVMGIDSSGNADFRGRITATELKLESGVKVPAGNVDGFDAYGGLELYLNQLDQRIQTYSQTTDPSTTWTTTEKTNHIGDLWFNPTDGLTKRWTGSTWETITDSDLEKLAQSKAQIFTSTPTPPYNIGDLWVQGTSGDIKRCIRTKSATQSYSASDWENASKYTDDSSLNTFISGDYADDLDTIRGQIDKKAETWYQSSDPSTAWTTDELKALHVGDLWKYTGTTTSTRTHNSEWIWQKVGSSYQWSEMKVPDEVFDAIDGKSSIYVDFSNITSQKVGDMLIPKSRLAKKYEDILYYFEAGKVYRCTATKDSFVPTDWVEINYTDDTKALEALAKAEQAVKDAADNFNLAQGYAKDYADTEVGKLDTAVGNYLGLDGSVLQGSNYIISPYIGGGYLNIIDDTPDISNRARVIIDPSNETGEGYIFQVYDGKKISVGIDKSGNAVFRGKITATELTLESGVDVPADKVDGLANVATSGKYSDLTGKPTIPTSVTQLTGGANILYTKDVSVSNVTTSDGTTKKKITVGSNSFDVIENGDFVLLGNPYGTNTSDGSKSYTYISKEGLLTAKNALIYGTVHATDGKFTGEVNATSGKFGNIELSNGSAVMGMLTLKASNPVDSNKYDYVDYISVYGGTKPCVYILAQSPTGVTNEIQEINIGADHTQLKNIVVNTNAKITCGDVFGTNITSDKNVKNNIELLSDEYDTLFDNLIPRRFKYDHGTSDRFHTGFVAQEIVEALEKSNLTTQDFATVVHLDEPLQNGAEWVLRKEEMVAINTWQIQKAKARISELENRVAELEEKINKLIN